MVRTAEEDFDSSDGELQAQMQSAARSKVDTVEMSTRLGYGRNGHLVEVR